MHEFINLLDFNKNLKSSFFNISPLKKTFYNYSIDYYFFSISPTSPYILTNAKIIIN